MYLQSKLVFVYLFIFFFALQLSIYQVLSFILNHPQTTWVAFMFTNNCLKQMITNTNMEWRVVKGTTYVVTQ